MRSLHSALRILLEFKDEPAELGVSEIATRTGFQKSHVCKVLAVLRSEQLVQQTPSRKYRVGHRSFMLGSRFLNPSGLLQAGLPLMDSFALDTGHSVALTILRNDDVLHILSVEGPLYPECRWRIGRKIAFHTSSSGRVLLAFRPETEVDRMIARNGLPKRTERTIVDRAQFIEAVRLARALGYAATWSEGTQGLGSVAVPVADETSQVIAALTAIFPERVAGPTDIGPLRDALFATARSLSAELGCINYIDGAAVRHARTGAHRTAWQYGGVS